ncbi:MAG: hypothetical protein ACYC9O_18615 [Candidatus Latescibacterota bacterium]
MEGRTAAEYQERTGKQIVLKHLPRVLTKREIEELLRDFNGRVIRYPLKGSDMRSNIA